MTIVAAADIAINTGLSHDAACGTKPIAKSFRALAPRPVTGGGTSFGPTFSSFRKWLTGEFSVIKPDVAVYEAPLNITRGGSAAVVTNQNTVRILFGLAAIFEEVCYTLSIPCEEANVQTVKKHFGAAGLKSADAKRAIQTRCRQLGWTYKNDNESDSQALWCLAKSLKDPSFSPSATPLFAVARR